MAEAGPGAAGGYVAFISYSHKDAAMGRWLHRKLEGYRLPKRLVGTQGEDGEVPERLTPIFRDRDELPAAGDLSERVRAALAVSRNLIVLCSPNSATSEWVAREIATFRELHPGRPIFAAIIDGEPGRCFSPALMEGGVEPLAADLRKEGDGRRLGMLKLVAGLAGVGLDALVQRDATRRIRRVSYVTVAAMAAMVAMALLTAFALTSRAEAQRERAEAEGLVEFMLTDLRNRLRSVGRLDVMQAVNERALRRYGRGADLSSFSEDALARRARILRAIGEDEIKLGRIADAEGALAEAHRVTSTQLTRNPDDPKRQLEHAHSEYWVGRVHELRREWADAFVHYRRFAEMTERLLSASPNNPDYLTAAASAAVDLGNLQLNGLKNYEGAQHSYERAISWFGRAAKARPEDSGGLRNQANAYGWLADSFYMRRDWHRSLNARIMQHQLVGQLHRANPSDREFSYRLALAERGVGASSLKVGDTAGARKHLFQAYNWALELTQTDPHNAEWQLFRALVACNLLYGEIGLPPRVDSRTLRGEVLTIGKNLEAAKNPRIKDLERCLVQLRKP